MHHFTQLPYKIPRPLRSTLLALVVFGVFGSLALWATQPATAQDETQAAVIVQFEDWPVLGRAISFTAPISGLVALELTGLDIVTTSTEFGLAVCSIEGVGCPATNCFCGTKYWGYNYWDGDAWQGYPVGAGSSVISQTGAVEGWHWAEFGDRMTPAPPVIAALRGLEWLRTQQSVSGDFGSAGATADVMLALSANKLAASAWASTTATTSTSVIDYWSQDANPADQYPTNAAQYVDFSAAAAGKLAVAAHATGQDLTDFANINLAETLRGYFGADGSIEGANNSDQTYGLLGWYMASDGTVPLSMTNVLASRVITDGGWGFLPNSVSDTNTTAVAIQALRAGGQCARWSPIANALTYVGRAQNADGGFANEPGSPSDANSTAFVVQALLSAGQDPAAAPWTKEGVGPIQYLLSLQVANGSFEYQAGGGGNQFATQQVVPALLGHTFLLDRPARACTDIFLPMAFLAQVR